jgi:hypothetical protein
MGKTSIERIDYLYKILIAPTTFFILLTWQIGLASFGNIYNLNILEKMGLQSEPKDIIIPFFTANSSSTFLMFSIFFYVIGYLYEHPFMKITSFYFLLLSLFFVASSYIFFIWPAEFDFLAVFINIVLSLILSFALFFDLRKNWKLYLLISILNFPLFINYFTYLRWVLGFVFLNVFIMWIYNKRFTKTKLA